MSLQNDLNLHYSNGDYDGYCVEQANAGVTQRNFFIRSYSSIDSIRDMLQKRLGFALKDASIIEHNADAVKGTHCHCVIRCVGVSTLSAIYGWFKECTNSEGRYGNTIVEVPYDIQSCYQYLIHANNPEKEPYDIIQIVHIGNSKACLNAISQLPEYNSVVRAWNDYMSGVSTDVLIRKYGKEYLYHAKQFEIADKNRARELVIDKQVLQLASDLKNVDDQVCRIQYLLLQNSHPKEIDGSEYTCIPISVFQDVLDTLDKIGGLL